MAHRFNWKKIGDALRQSFRQRKFLLEQQIIAEEIRRVQEDPNSIEIPADASIEEDLKAVRKLFNKSVQSEL